MIESGIESLREVQAELLASEAVYIRPGCAERRLRAVPGRTVFRSTNEYGAWIRIETRDFIVAAKDLDSEPQPGDAIVFRDAEYEVLSPNGEPCWRWDAPVAKRSGCPTSEARSLAKQGLKRPRDPYKTAYRIHTKHTGGEP